MVNKIKQFRFHAGITQAELAESCGWEGSQSRIANYETSLRVPSLNDMRTIVSALNASGCECSIDDVFPPNVEHASNLASA